MIRTASDVEQNIVSVERILQYVTVDPEAPAEIPETKPAPEWPQAGAIRLEDYSMRYRADLEPVLRGVNVDIVRATCGYFSVCLLYWVLRVCL